MYNDYQTLLELALRSQSLTIAKMLGPSPFRQRIDPSHCQNASPEFFKFIGKIPQGFDKRGYPCSFIAARSGNLQLLKYLKQQKKLQQTSKHGEPILHFSLKNTTKRIGLVFRFLIQNCQWHRTDKDQKWAHELASDLNLDPVRARIIRYLTELHNRAVGHT